MNSISLAVGSPAVPLRMTSLGRTLPLLLFLAKAAQRDRPWTIANGTCRTARERETTRENCMVLNSF